MSRKWVSERKVGWRDVEEGKGGQMEAEGELTLGGKHMM